MTECVTVFTGEREPLPADAGGRPAMVTGLCLARLAELRTGGRAARADWDAIPYLLVATVGADPDAYRFSHLARAFNAAGATRSACLSGELAVETSPGDQWVVETRIITLANHSGSYEIVAAAIDAYEQFDSADRRWAEVARAAIAIVDGRQPDPQDTASPEAEEWWARWPRIAQRVIASGVGPCTGELEELAEGLRGAGEDHEMRADVLRVLGRPDEADAVIAVAESGGMIDLSAARSARAFTTLARGGDLAEAEALLHQDYGRTLIPYRLRGAVNLDLPLLAVCAPHLDEVVQRLTRTCRERLAILEERPPPLTAELEKAGGTVPHSELVHAGLELLEAGAEATWSQLADLVDRLGRISAAGALSPAVAQLRRHVAGRAADRAVGASVERGEAGAEDLIRLADRLEPLLDTETVVRLRIAALPSMLDSDDRAGVLRSLRDHADEPLVVDALARLLVTESTEGRLARARAVYLASQQLPDAANTFDADVAELVDSIPAFRAVHAVLDSLTDDHDANETVRGRVGQTRARVDDRLDDVVGVNHDTRESTFPYVTPIEMELGVDIVPLVNPAEDEGVFLDQYIPEMKARLTTAAGVSVPGVRLRPSEVIPVRDYLIQVDEVTVAQGTLSDAAVVVRRDDRRDADGPENARWHPLTGDPGRWRLEPVADGGDGHGDTGAALPPARHLLFLLESTLRQHLWRFMTLDAVADLTNQWRADDPELVAAVLPDESAVRRLTWLVQAALRDGAGLADWRGFLTAIRERGGLRQPLGALRTWLRPLLSPLDAGDDPIPVPEELKTAALDAGNPAARVELLGWLKRTVDEHGPILTLLVHTVEGSELVCDLGRTVSRKILVRLPSAVPA